MRTFSDLEQRLLNEFQHAIPLTPTPWADIARELGVYETTVLKTLQGLQTEGVVSRVGAVFHPNRIGASTLAAIAVPPERLEAVAELVNEFPEVNHNYEREHEFNLWFVAVADDEFQVVPVPGEHPRGWLVAVQVSNTSERQPQPRISRRVCRFAHRDAGMEVRLVPAVAAATADDPFELALGDLRNEPHADLTSESCYGSRRRSGQVQVRVLQGG